MKCTQHLGYERETVSVCNYLTDLLAEVCAWRLFDETAIK
jgi:hypothetical protein